MHVKETRCVISKLPENSTDPVVGGRMIYGCDFVATVNIYFVATVNIYITLTR